MNRRKGLTLVELVVAAALLGILAGVGTPYLLANLPTLRVNAAVRHLVGDLRLARTLAAERGVDCLVVFAAAGTEYTLLLDADGTPGPSAGDEPVKTVRLGRLYQGVEFSSSQTGTAVTFPSGTARFKPRGTANGGTVFVRPAGDAGIREDRERKVTVMATTGRVRAFRWSGAAWEG